VPFNSWVITVIIWRRNSSREFRLHQSNWTIKIRLFCFDANYTKYLRRHYVISSQ